MAGARNTLISATTRWLQDALGRPHPEPVGIALDHQRITLHALAVVIEHLGNHDVRMRRDAFHTINVLVQHLSRANGHTESIVSAEDIITWARGTFPVSDIHRYEIILTEWPLAYAAGDRDHAGRCGGAVQAPR